MREAVTWEKRGKGFYAHFTGRFDLLKTCGGDWLILDWDRGTQFRSESVADCMLWTAKQHEGARHERNEAA